MQISPLESTQSNDMNCPQTNKYTSIALNWKTILFLVLIEICTIPFVAISNTFTASNQFYVACAGIVAFPALIVVIKIVLPMLRQHLAGKLQLNILKITGIIYVSLISGFLLVFMFYLQELTYRFTNSDCIVGLVSAFFSVGISLAFYQIIQHKLHYGIKLLTPNGTFILALIWKDIIILTLLFTLYETIASPISIIWVPHHEHRFLWGIISGILSGLCGGIPLAIISKLTGYQINLCFRPLDIK